MSSKPRVALFASGRGSNVTAIYNFSRTCEDFEIGLIISNRRNAGVLDYAFEHDLPSVIISKSELNDPDTLLPILKKHEIDMIVLAGFLLLIPGYLVSAYRKRILNIHPAVLPNYGGQGMYGHYVHEAVAANHDAYSGITIHLVNEHYDEGSIIFQTRCQLSDDDSAEDIATKVLRLEHHFYPQVVAGFASKLNLP